MAQGTGSYNNNDLGWWNSPKIQDPPYLTPDPGQDGNDLDFYGASLMGYRSGMYGNDTKVDCPDSDGDS